MTVTKTLQDDHLATTVIEGGVTALRTSSAWSGKLVRMGYIFGPHGRAVIVPVDHGLMLGRCPGLEDPMELVHRFLPPRPNGFLLSPGLAERTAPWFAHRGAPARVLTIDTYWRGATTGKSVLTRSLARAAALGADGVKLLMPWDVAPEVRAACSAFVASVISEAEPYGLPVIVEPVCLGTPGGANAVAMEAYGCRMGAELGADILKVPYPGDADVLATWCAELRLPLLILGGPPVAPLTSCVRWSRNPSKPVRAESSSAVDSGNGRSKKRWGSLNASRRLFTSRPAPDERSHCSDVSQRRGGSVRSL